MSESVVRWAMSGCSSGLALTLGLAMLLIPAQYYVPELAPPPVPEPTPTTPAWLERALDFPLVDLFATLTLLLLGLLTYLCEWIQRKIMEKRIVKVPTPTGYHLHVTFFCRSWLVGSFAKTARSWL